MRMQGVKWAAVLLGVALLCSACSVEGQNAVPESSAKENTGSTSRQEENDQASSHTETRNLTMVEGPRNQIGGNQRGAYFLWSTGNGHQMLYVDYDTKALTAWTNQLKPTQDEANPGWLNDTDGGTEPYVTEDAVYVLKKGNLPLPGVGYAGSPCKLSKLSLDGTVRRTITLPLNQVILQNSGVAAEGDKLYLLVGTYDKNGDLERCDICYSDFEKEQLFPIATLETADRYALVGVYEQGLLLQKTTVPAEYEKKSHQEKMAHYVYELDRFSLDDSTLTKCISWKTGERSCVYREGGVYYLDRETGSLNWYDAQKDQDQMLFENIVPDEYEKQALSLYGEDYGDHLVGSLCGADGETLWVGIDLHSGSCTPITLSYEYNMGTMPVTILAQTKDQFLVDAGQVDRMVPMIDENGNMHEMVQPVTQFALIKQEDYWASRPNYEMITNHYFA